MSFIDIIILFVVGGFALAGLWFGFVHTLGSLLGTVLGAYLASRYYEPMADWLIRFTGWGENTTRLVMFVVAFFIINRLVGFLFWLIEKIFNLVTLLPFIRSINKFLGFLLGTAEGIITVGLVVFFIERFPLTQPFMQRLSESSLAPRAASVAQVLWPLLPDALILLRSTVDYLTHKVL